MKKFIVALLKFLGIIDRKQDGSLAIGILIKAFILFFCLIGIVVVIAIIHALYQPDVAAPEQTPIQVETPAPNDSEKTSRPLGGNLYYRNSSDSADMFVYMVEDLADTTIDRDMNSEPKSRYNEDSISHGPFEFTWNGKTAIVVCYDSTVADSNGSVEEFNVNGHLFLQTNSSSIYKRYLFSVGEDGGWPAIKSIFTANADNDSEKELIVFVGWEQRNYDVSGTFYGVQVYDFPKSKDAEELMFLSDVSEKIKPGSDLEWQEGGSEKAILTTAAEIKAELKRLGY